MHYFCVWCSQMVILIYTEAVTKNKDGKISFKGKHQKFNTDEDEPVGTVMIGIDHQHICVPGNATITVPGKSSKINNKGHICWSLLLMPIYHQAQ